MNCTTRKQAVPNLQTRPPSPKDFSCLSKSSLSRFCSPSTCLFRLFPRKLEWAAARQQQSALQHNCRCTEHWDFNLQYTTGGYTTAPTTCNEQVQSVSGRPAESSSIAPQTLKFSLFLWQRFVFLSSRSYHRFVTFNGWKQGLWFTSGRKNRPREGIRLINAVITATVCRYKMAC